MIDCPEPAALAGFHRRLVGGEVTSAADDWVAREPEPGLRPALQRADEYAPPLWPEAERPQQAHPDVTVDDIDEAERAVLTIGASKRKVQPGEADGEPFRVYLALAGRPLCLCWD